MTTTADRPATGNGLSRAERERMLAGVEKLIQSRVCKSSVSVEDREDVAGDIRLKLWELLEHFDPNGSAQWSTFAASVANTMLRNRWDAEAGRREHPACEIDADRTPDPATEAADDEPDDDDLGDHAGALTTAVRRQLAGPALDALSPGYRSLVEQVVFDRLTVDQIAAQHGWPVKVVKTNLQKAIGHLAAAGHVSERMAALLGLNVGELAARVDPAAKAAKMAARRGLVAEAVALGWSNRRIAAELGEPEGTVARDVKRLRADQPAEASAV